MQATQQANAVTQAPFAADSGQSRYARCIEASKRIRWDIDKDVFFYHWREESQHAILDELEWRREHARLTDAGRDRAVNDLIDLVAAVDGILVAQAKADTRYFLACANRAFSATEESMIGDGILKAYRWQYIVSGVQDPRFTGILAELVTDEQMHRITAALAPLMQTQ